AGDIAKHSYTFVPLDPILVTLGPSARASALRFTGQLEVTPEAEEVVTTLKPRILDVLNDYLRAVEESEMEDPGALAMLRAQMLRRIQVVTGDGMVRDLLVTEFVLN
ncbi:MAG: flagellar basal body-associated FliL family protein, partial [Pseudomonadota bacterium]